MNKVQILSTAIVVSVMAVSCSPAASPPKKATEVKNQPQTALVVDNATFLDVPAQARTSISTPASSSTPKANAIKTKPPSLTAAKPATSTPTLPAECTPVDGLDWSVAFPAAINSIHSLFKASDGNYIISGELYNYAGTWVAKVNPDGKLIWQEQFTAWGASVKPAQNGNILIQYRTQVMELDNDGKVLFSTQASGMQLNTDGSRTLLGEGQIMRFNNLDEIKWSLDFADFEMYGDATTDGGAIYAYAGSYVDKSVYFAPFYTDIKVIKVDGSGQVWQRVYGVLTGNETLEYVLPTEDGGAILAGTHSYSDTGNDYDIWLMKVNQSGSLSWQTTLKKAPDNNPIAGVYLLSKGVLILSNDIFTNDLQLIFLNNKGSLMWQKQVSSVRGWISIQSAENTSDGGLVIAGKTGESTEVSFLARFDNKGKLIWEKLTGFYGVENSPDSTVDRILPLADGMFLIGGQTNVSGQGLALKYGAWLAKIADEGEIQNFLVTTPGTFSAIKTISARPKTLPDLVIEAGSMTIKAVNPDVITTNFQTHPACIAGSASYPTPQALPSLTPTQTLTASRPAQTRNLYLASPAMQGDDVLLLQKRLFELGYEEVGALDGIFGKMTQSAVMSFQQNNNLEVDGYVGEKTWYQLFSPKAKGK
jgi:peptidoglycan hydrolase-like protein with peptidoglycan-binding domain